MTSCDMTPPPRLPWCARPHRPERRPGSRAPDRLVGPPRPLRACPLAANDGGGRDPRSDRPTTEGSWAGFDHSMAGVVIPLPGPSETPTAPSTSGGRGGGRARRIGEVPRTRASDLARRRGQKTLAGRLLLPLLARNEAGAGGGWTRRKGAKSTAMGASRGSDREGSGAPSPARGGRRLRCMAKRRAGTSWIFHQTWEVDVPVLHLTQS